MSQFFAVPSDVDVDRAEDDPPHERVVIKGKVYSKKRANLPFLKGHRWPVKDTTEMQNSNVDGEVDANRKNRRDGTSPPAYERASDVSRSVLRYSALLVLGTLLLSRMITQTWAWGYSVNVMHYIPRSMQTFSEAELRQFDGSDLSRPIYLALDGDVFDVSSNPNMYGKGGSYNHFAGRDAARAFVTGCFKKHLTHDIRGFSDKEIKQLQGWKKFFSKHAKYYKVGRVVHPPIPPSSPLPLPCNPKEEGGAR